MSSDGLIDVQKGGHYEYETVMEKHLYRLQGIVPLFPTGTLAAAALCAYSDRHPAHRECYTGIGGRDAHGGRLKQVYTRNQRAYFYSYAFDRV